MKKYFGVALLILCSISAFSCTKLDLSTKVIDFSLDRGASWQRTGGELEEFDLLNTDSGGNDKSMVFFSATTYEEFISNTSKYDIIDRTNDIKELKDTYDKNYFEDYVMLYYYKYEGCVSRNYAYNVTINKNILTLNINRFEGMATAISTWTQVVSVKKSEIKGVNRFKVKIQTIAPLLESIMVSIAENHVREVYINGLSKSDFTGLANLKDISVFTWNLNVDIYLNTTLTDERLEEIIDIFRNSSNISSVGYTSTTHIRIQVNTKLFDSVVNNTLVITDLIPANILDSSTFSIKFLTFNPFAYITLYLIKPGRVNADAMVLELRQMNFPFINSDSLDSAFH